MTIGLTALVERYLTERRTHSRCWRAGPRAGAGAARVCGELLPSDPPGPLASLHWDRHDVESVCLRIGTATDTQTDRRALSTWLSHGELLRLVLASVTAPGVGCTVAWGVPGNTRSWWRSPEAWQRPGYVPQDNAEGWANLVEPIDFAPGTPMARLQDGHFLGIGPSGRLGGDDPAAVPRGGPAGPF